ncbi:MAG: radical SAM protein, partial [Candidatus Omnitrophica bacterium]|nr:radical SAM protein [Candidatus Omnitrophota bacterium]
ANHMWEKLNGALQSQAGESCNTPVSIKIGEIAAHDISVKDYSTLKRGVKASRKGIPGSALNESRFRLSSRDIRIFDQGQKSSEGKYQRIWAKKRVSVKKLLWTTSGCCIRILKVLFTPVLMPYYFFYFLFRENRARKKVLLIASPLNSSSFREADKKGGVFIAPPFGLYRMKSYLEKKGLADVEVFDPNLYPEDALKRARAIVSEGKFDIIGFSLTHVNMSDEMRWIEALKTESLDEDMEWPLLIGGGTEATHNYKEWLKHSSLNGIVMGYGEKALEGIIQRMDSFEGKLNMKWHSDLPMYLALNLLKHILKRHAPPMNPEEVLRGIKGVALRRVTGGIEMNPALPVEQDAFQELTFFNAPVENIPYKEYWDINKADFDPENMATRGATIKTIRLFTSSHCRNNCGFCSSCNFLNAATGKKYVPVFRLSPENMHQLVLESVRLHNPEGIFFNDDDFIIDRGSGRERVLQFCRLVSESKKKGDIPSELKLYCQTKVKNIASPVYTPDGRDTGDYRVDEELLETMKEAGFILIAMGVESFSSEMLAKPSIDKKVRSDRGVAAIKGVREADMIPLMNIIMLPPEITPQTFAETSDTVIEQIKRGAQLSLAPFVEWFPGSGISPKVKSGEYPHTTTRVYSSRRDRFVEYPVTVLPIDPRMRKAALELEEQASRILAHLKRDENWPYRYPPQLIRGLTYMAAVFRSLDREDKVREIIGLIWELVKFSGRSKISGAFLSHEQFNALVERANGLIKEDGMSIEKARDLLFIAGDIKLARKVTYNRIVDHLLCYLEDIIEKEKNTRSDLGGDRKLRERPSDRGSREEEQIVRFIAENIARMEDPVRDAEVLREANSERISKALALLNFYGLVRDVPILEDYYIDSEHVVTLYPEGNMTVGEKEVSDEFKGKKVMVFEPHQDDALIQLGHTLESSIVGNAEKVALVTLFNDPQGVTDDYARDNDPETFAKNPEQAKRYIRFREGEEYAKAIGVEYIDLKFRSPLDEDKADKDEKGRLRAYHSDFRKIGAREINQIVSKMQKFTPDVMIIPFPRGSYHQHHRDAAQVLIAALIKYNEDREKKGEPPVKIQLYLYAANISGNGFFSYGITPNIFNPLTNEQEDRKARRFADHYGSQLSRNPSYPRHIMQLDIDTAVKMLYAIEGEMSDEDVFGETLLRSRIGTSEEFLREKQRIAQNKLNNSMRILSLVYDELLEKRSRETAVINRDVPETRKSAPIDNIMRLRILDGNIMYEKTQDNGRGDDFSGDKIPRETANDFDFLPVTLEGNNIREMFDSLKILSITVDPSGIKRDFVNEKKKSEKVFRELVMAFYYDDADKLLDLMRSEEGASILSFEMFSRENISEEAADRLAGCNIVYWQDILRARVKQKDKKGREPEEFVVSGHQPGYHYYLGIMNKIAAADVFTLSDLFEFRRGNWQNRQAFVDGEGQDRWLTVPVVHDGSKLIRGKKIDNREEWKKSHWRIINEAYEHEPYFWRYAPFFEELYKREWDSLVALDEAITRYMAVKLGLETMFIRTSLIGIGDDIGHKVEAIANLMESVVPPEMMGGDREIVYLSGRGAENYLGKLELREVSEEAGIEFPGQLLIDRGFQLRYIDYPEDEIKLAGFNPRAPGAEILFQRGPEARDIVFWEEGLSPRARAVLKLQYIAMKYVEKARELEKDKYNISPKDSAKLSYYVKMLEYIYREIEALTTDTPDHSPDEEYGRQKNMSNPVVIDAENPVSVYAPLLVEQEGDFGGNGNKAAVQEEGPGVPGQGPEALKEDVIEQVGLFTPGQPHERTDVVIAGRFAESYRDFLEKEITGIPYTADRIGEIRTLLPHQEEEEGYEYELLDTDELFYLYGEEQGQKDTGTAENLRDPESLARTAYVLMAAGSGTRLAEIFKKSYEDRIAMGLEDIDPDSIENYSKTTFPLTRLQHKNPFQLIVESLSAIARDASTDVPVVIICTDSSRPVIERILEENGNFGLKNIILKNDIPGPPMFDNDGRVLRDGKDIVLSGGGTGGTLRTLDDKGFSVGTGGEERADTPFEWLEEKGVDSLCFLQCDMPYNADILRALGTYKNSGPDRLDLVALGYTYPQDKEGHSHKYELGTVLRRKKRIVSRDKLWWIIKERAQAIYDAKAQEAKEKGLEYSPGEQGTRSNWLEAEEQVIGEFRKELGKYLSRKEIEERVRREAERIHESREKSEGRTIVSGKDGELAEWREAERNVITSFIDTSYQVVEYRDRTRKVKQMISNAEEEGEGDRIAAYAGGMRISLDVAREFVLSDRFEPEVHWNKMEKKKNDGLSVLVNKIQYSLTDLYWAVDRLRILMVPFKRVSPMKDPEKLSFTRRSLQEIDRENLLAAGVSEIGEDVIAEISPLAVIESIGRKVKILDSSMVYFGGSPAPDRDSAKKITIEDDVIIEGRVRVILEGVNNVVFRQGVRISGEGVLHIGDPSGRDIEISSSIHLDSGEKRIINDRGEISIPQDIRAKAERSGRVKEEAADDTERSENPQEKDGPQPGDKRPETFPGSPAGPLWSPGKTFLLDILLASGPVALFFFSEGIYKYLSLSILGVVLLIRWLAGRVPPLKERAGMIRDRFFEEKENSGRPAATVDDAEVLIGVPSAVYTLLDETGNLEALEQDLSGSVKIVDAGAGGDEEMVRAMEREVPRGDCIAAVVSGDIFDGASPEDMYREILEIISDFSEKAKKDIARLLDPRKYKLAEGDISRIKRMSELKDIMKVLIKTMPAGRSYGLSEMSVRQLRIEKLYKELHVEDKYGSGAVRYDSGLGKNGRTHYLAHFADWKAVVNGDKKGIVPPGLEIEERRSLMNIANKEEDLYKDKFFIAAPRNVVTESEKAAFRHKVIELWMLEGIVEEDDLVVLPAKDEPYGTSEILNALKASVGQKAVVEPSNAAVRCLAGELRYDKAAEEKGVVQLNIAQNASSTVYTYRVLVNLLIHKGSRKIYIEKGLRSIISGLFVFCPQITKIHLEDEIRRYYDRFVKEIAVKA